MAPSKPGSAVTAGGLAPPETQGSASTAQEEVPISRVFLRLASAQDVGHVLELIVRLARFHEMEEDCHASREKLLATVFQDPSRTPFHGPTVILAEVGFGTAAEGLHAPEGQAEEAASGDLFSESYDVSPDEGSSLPASVEDPERTQFVSEVNPNRTVVGFALAFPNYSTFLTTPGLWLEDIYVREQYRRFGVGTRLLRFITRVAHRQGMGRVDWSVIVWNDKAIQFYTKRMGAKVLDDWRICRLEGKSLEAAALAVDL